MKEKLGGQKLEKLKYTYLVMGDQGEIPWDGKAPRPQ